MGKTPTKTLEGHQKPLNQDPSLFGGVAVRRMDVSDLKEVTEIEKRTYPRPWPLIAFQEEMQPDPFRNAYVLFGPAVSKILGYTCFWILEGELSLLNLTIHPAHRRQGLGTQFLGWILTTGARRGTAQAVLEVRGSNRNAIRLYEKAGFFRLGRRKNYYQSPEEDALILCHRTLDSLTT